MCSDAAMPMDQWRKLFTDIILSRGAGYSRRGAVRILQQDAMHLEADVAGTETYHVQIELKDGTIDHMHCSCPYAADGERNCKHMAAVLFTAYAPEQAQAFHPQEKQTPPPRPNCTQVTIRVANEETTAKRYCAIPEVKVGDDVVFLLNERETVGTVESIQQMPCPIEIYGYGRKNHVLSISEKSESPGILTIQLRPSSPFVMLIVATEAGLKRIRMKREWVEAHHVKVGDMLLLEGEAYERAAVLDMDDDATEDLPTCRVIAVRENDEFATLLNSQVTFLMPDDIHQPVQLLLRRWTGTDPEARIPYGVKRVSAFAFEDNGDVRRVTIAGNYVHLDSFAFGHNESIEEIVFEADEVSFVPSSFEGCKRLHKLALPYTFYHMKNELARRLPGVEITYRLNGNVLEGDVVYSKDKTKLVCCTNKELTSFHCPNSVREILPNAFSGCRKLRRWMSTPFIQTWGMGCLSGCVNLKKVAVPYKQETAFILMFGETYCPGAKPVTLTRKDDSEVTFYLPKACTLTQLPTMKEALRTMSPEALAVEDAYAVAEYFEREHNMGQAVAWYGYTYRSGLKKAKDKLIILLQNEAYHQYFALEDFDELRRAKDLAPFLHAFALTETGEKWGGMTAAQLMKALKDKNVLHAFLKDVASAEIPHNDLLSTMLKRLYPKFGRKAELDTKALFYRCARKLRGSEGEPSWCSGLLTTLLAHPAYQRMFLFDRLDLRYTSRNRQHEQLIASLADESLKEDVAGAYEASLHPQSSNVALYRQLIQKAKDTGDEVYQWCGLLSVWTYTDAVWRSKDTEALKNVLQTTLDACTEGLYDLGQLILSYRQNLQRNIPRSFYRVLAARLHQQGKLFFNDYENLLGDGRTRQLDFFYRYADWLDEKEQHPMLWAYLQHSWVYVPGIALQDEKGKRFKDALARPYETFIPLKTGDDLILYSNTHEAVCYMMEKGLPVADYYFCMPYACILTIMDRMQLDEALLMPCCLNRKITKQALEQMWK